MHHCCCRFYRYFLARSYILTFFHLHTGTFLKLLNQLRRQPHLVNLALWKMSSYMQISAKQKQEKSFQNKKTISLHKNTKNKNYSTMRISNFEICFLTSLTKFLLIKFNLSLRVSNLVAFE